MKRTLLWVSVFALAAVGVYDETVSHATPAVPHVQIVHDFAMGFGVVVIILWFLFSGTKIRIDGVQGSNERVFEAVRVYSVWMIQVITGLWVAGLAFVHATTLNIPTEYHRLAIILMIGNIIIMALVLDFSEVIEPKKLSISGGTESDAGFLVQGFFLSFILHAFKPEYSFFSIRCGSTAKFRKGVMSRDEGLITLAVNGATYKKLKR